MTKGVKKTDDEKAIEMRKAVMANPKQVKKLKSSSFWQLFGIRKRTPNKIREVKGLLELEGLELSSKSGAQFGKEPHDDWIIITPIGGPALPFLPSPPKGWFELMMSRQFESEREVETFFALPVLLELGYKYDDIALGYPVEMQQGVKVSKKEADIVLFDGLEHKAENTLLVVEAKKSNAEIPPSALGQLVSYCKVLWPPYYVITNGEHIRVYKLTFSRALDKMIMDFPRGQLEEKWTDLYCKVSRPVAVARKKRLIELSQLADQ